MYSQPQRGLFHVVYKTEADMRPELQKDLVIALEQAVELGPVALVFTVKQAAVVDKAVPVFWMDVTKRLAPRLSAMAIASPSMVVRTAAHGFSVANKLRRVTMAVTAFESEAEALGWARERLDAPAAATGPSGERGHGAMQKGD